MKHTMIAELEVDGGKSRATGFEVCAWCGVRRVIEIRAPDDPDDPNECVSKPGPPSEGSPNER